MESFKFFFRKLPIRQQIKYRHIPLLNQYNYARPHNRNVIFLKDFKLFSFFGTQIVI